MNEEKETVGVVCVCEACYELDFFDLLLDSTSIRGQVYILKDVIEEVGNVNHKLEEKKVYEWVLRIAKKYRILCVTQEKFKEWLSGQLINEERWISIKVEETEFGFKTECYIIGRYKAELLQSGLFNTVVQKLLLLENQELNTYLEKMISNSEEFYRLYDATQPILIYSGYIECHGILDYFAKEFGKALSRRGERIIYFDISKHKIQDIADYTGVRWKAIIGVQTYMFSVKYEDGTFVHDVMNAPLFHFVFDHPVWMRNHLEQVPKRMEIFTLDRNYVKFIEKYYGHKALFFPPGGVEKENGNGIPFKERKYEISFLGDYGDGLVEKLFTLKKEDKEKAKFANTFLQYLREDLSQTPETVMHRVMEIYYIPDTTVQLLELLSEYRWMIYGLSKYYRKKVVKGLLESGIELHVYGSTWKQSPFVKYKNLICHEMVQGEDALEVYAQSKISLNVMSWHKAGFTERIANAMLQKSVVLTDKTTYLEEEFEDGQDIVLFDLKYMNQVPKQVKALLADIGQMEKIAERGYQRAKMHHTWDIRAKKFLKKL